MNATPPDDLVDILDGCLAAIDTEIAAVQEDLVRRGLDRPLAAEGGRLVQATGPGHRYAWRLPSTGLDIRPDDGVRVRIEDRETLGFVVRYERRSSELAVSVQDWLGRQPGRAELEFDPTWLLSALSGRLEAIRHEPDRFHPDTLLRLFGRVFPDLGREEPVLDRTGELNAAQGDALARLLGSDAHFIWGPPGTGKTRLLGHAVAELSERGTVLVAATTNGAVDEAAVRVADAVGVQGIEANRVIRVGAEFSATGDPFLSLEAALERRVRGGSGGIEAAFQDLERALRVRGRAPSTDGPGALRARYGRLLAAARSAGDEAALRRLMRLGGDLQKEQVRALRDADVVLTTLARLAVRDELASLRFDSLVLDEASTAPLPYVALAAAQTRRRAVAIGDFQQLPAVVISRDEEAGRWLSRDVFREAGVIRDAPSGELPLPGEHDRLCAMLVEQYRMAPPIRALVSDLFYGGRLSDAPTVLRRPAPAAPLVLLDTESLDPQVERAEGSRANAAHAETVVGFLQMAASAGLDDIAVVAPYRLQSRRIWRLARTRLGRAAPRNLEVSTIHRFQGREKSVVVFDTVDAPPARSWFLHEGRNRDFPRLLNVALSRTRDMLVLVGTPEGLQRTLPPDALLNRVVERMRREGRRVEARQLAAEAPTLFGSAGSVVG